MGIIERLLDGKENKARAINWYVLMVCSLACPIIMLYGILFIHAERWMLKLPLFFSFFPLFFLLQRRYYFSPLRMEETEDKDEKNQDMFAEDYDERRLTRLIRMQYVVLVMGLLQVPVCLISFWGKGVNFVVLTHMFMMLQLTCVFFNRQIMALVRRKQLSTVGAQVTEE